MPKLSAPVRDSLALVRAARIDSSIGELIESALSAGRSPADIVAAFRRAVIEESE